MKNYDELIERLANAASNLRGTPGKALLVDSTDAIQSLQAENEQLQIERLELDTQLKLTSSSVLQLRAKLAALQSDDDLPPLPEPAGKTAFMPGTQGFTMSCFNADVVPANTNLYSEQQFIQGQRDAQAMLRAKLAGQEVVKMQEKLRQSESWNQHLYKAFVQQECCSVAYGNALTDYYRREVATNGKDDRSIAMEVNNRLADVWRQSKCHPDIPVDFLNPFAAPVVAGAAPQAQGQVLLALKALVGEYGKNMASMRVDAPRRKLWRDACDALAKAAPQGEQQ